MKKSLRIGWLSDDSFDSTELSYRIPGNLRLFAESFVAAGHSLHAYTPLIKGDALKANKTIAYEHLLSGATLKNFDLAIVNSDHHLPLLKALSADIPVLLLLNHLPTPDLICALSTAEPLQVRGLATSQHLKKCWQDYLSPIFLLPRQIDGNFWQPLKHPVRDYFVWAEDITRDSQLETVISAVKALRKKLFIAGNIKDKPYFNRHIAPLLDPYAHYTGQLDKTDLRYLLGQARALIFTSECPTGGYIREALALGVPVVASDVYCVREIVPDSCGIFVKNPSKISWLAALNRVHQCSREACVIYANLRWKYSEEDTSELFLSVLESVSETALLSAA